MYFKKATNICDISTLDLFGTAWDEFKVVIFQKS